MEDARGQTASLRLGATASDGRDAEFGASGTVITFRGFLAAYEEGRDDEAKNGDDERRLPQLEVGEAVDATSLEPDGHSTSPPARYTEASLVKALEERGIGRPSTYASIMGTILDRGYVFKKGTALVPTFLAFSVTQLLEKHFERLVDYDFTALTGGRPRPDRRGQGEPGRLAQPLLPRAKAENGLPAEEGLHALVTDHLEDIDARDVNSIEIPGADGHRAARRPLRPVPGAGRRARQRPRRHGAGRADRREGRGAAGEALGRPRARRRSRDGPAGRCARRPLRAVRQRGAGGGLDRQAAHGIALQDDVARDGRRSRTRCGCSRCRER